MESLTTLLIALLQLIIDWLSSMARCSRIGTAFNNNEGV
jgi:hypothetical protein